MNKSIIALAAVLMFPLTGIAFPGNPDHFAAHHEKRMERMAEELKLNGEQKKQIDAIFKEQRTKFETIHQETHSRLEKVLTPEQLKEMDANKKQRHENWEKKREECKAGK